MPFLLIQPVLNIELYIVQMKTHRYVDTGYICRDFLGSALGTEYVSTRCLELVLTVVARETLIVVEVLADINVSVVLQHRNV